MKHIGQQIKRYREELNLTQDQLAKKVGYSSRSSINKIEQGVNDISQSKIVDFAKALFVTPAQLLGIEENANFDEQILDSVYLSFAKQAAQDGIDPRDIYAAIELIRNLKDKKL